MVCVSVILANQNSNLARLPLSVHPFSVGVHPDFTTRTPLNLLGVHLAPLKHQIFKLQYYTLLPLSLPLYIYSRRRRSGKILCSTVSSLGFSGIQARRATP